MNRIASTVITLAAAAALVFAGTVSAKQEKVTICHATSSETNPYVTLTIAYPAVYGPAGHFNENGTTQAGHEEDYFGPCQSVESPSPSVTPTSEPSSEPSPSATPDASVEPTTEPSPTPSPEPSTTPEPTPEPTQEPSSSPEPSTPASPEPSSETQPSPPPSVSPQTTPGSTLPPTDMASRPAQEPWTRLPLDFLLAMALGVIFICATLLKPRSR